MAILIACAECGAEISSDVHGRCPRCGARPGPSMCRICCRQDKIAALNSSLLDYEGNGAHATCFHDHVSAHLDIREFSCPTCKTTFRYDVPQSYFQRAEAITWPCSTCGQPIGFSTCYFCSGMLMGGRQGYRDMHVSCRPASVRFEHARKAVMKRFYAEVWRAADLCPECGGQSDYYLKEGFFGLVKTKVWRCERCRHSWQQRQ